MAKTVQDISSQPTVPEAIKELKVLDSVCTCGCGSSPRPCTCGCNCCLPAHGQGEQLERDR